MFAKKKDAIRMKWNALQPSSTFSDISSEKGAGHRIEKVI